ncbi:hypothetical protein EYF80_050627 [Liparis tanakae]|uniref:Uncharacterized protein n=1 Tax=Liparis tanakae TaxID=230148 RepID=A0A4Z2FD80_9TELE|nr:hypothetical protein EYF80_050627 [Liparis tanakae]
MSRTTRAPHRETELEVWRTRSNIPMTLQENVSFARVLTESGSRLAASGSVRVLKQSFLGSCIASNTGDSAQRVGRRAEGEAHAGSQIQFVLRDSGRRSETKVLQEADEEDEELHPGQTLSDTNPPP